MIISDWIIDLPWWDILRWLCYIVGAIIMSTGLFITALAGERRTVNPKNENQEQGFWDYADMILILSLFVSAYLFVAPMNFPDIDKEARALLLQEIFKSLGSK